MKRLFAILISVLLYSLASAQTRTVYTCPMHPEVQSSKAGNCLKCGMTLVKKTVKAKTGKTTAQKPEQSQPSQPAKKVVYTCPMHPEVQALSPGKCPKCGMTLEKKTVSKSSPKTTAVPTQVDDTARLVTDPGKRQQADPVYTCPMHPEVQANEPGKCHKCGMDLIIKDSQSKEQPVESKIVYTCVMHPEIQQEKPGNCPRCGMTLVRKTVPVLPVEDSHTATRDESTDAMVGSQVNLHPGRTVVYHLYVKDTMVNFTGKRKMAIAINGSIPAPTLVFTEGDTAEIHLHNMLKEETSLHWHGIILPNRFDGVTYLTTRRIGPGDSYVYKFKIVQNGTYWYHSHSGLQEQIGMYGALVLRKRDSSGVSATHASIHTAHSHDSTIDHSGHAEMNIRQDTVKHYNVVLSEWTDANPMQIHRRLRMANDWFSIQKGSTQSYSEAVKEGHLKTKLINEWKRMKAMDVSDVFYEKFLVNGQPVVNVPQFKPGDRVRLRIVNAGASSYFWLTWGGGKITVVGNDGNDVEPVAVDRLIIAVAETYDVEVTIPDNRSYEFRATSEDRIGYSSLWLGTGVKVSAPTLPRLKYFEGMKMMNDMMRTDGTMTDMGMKMSLQKMDMNMVMYPEITGGKGDKGSGNNPKPEEKTRDTSVNTHNMDHSTHGMSMPVGGDIVTLNYDMLRSPINTSLQEGRTRVLHFTLTGNMNRYLWTLDNKTVTESDKILIDQGEVLRIILTNNSMMRHPMHLHGHDFRVLNSHGEYSPLKNVLDIMPMETDTIEFAANQDGNWFFHCHILYHMMAGMGRVFTYANSPVNPDLPNSNEAYRKFRKHRDQNMKHLTAKIGLESNGSDGEAMLSSNRFALITEWRIGLHERHGLESETMLGRYLGPNQWWLPYVGFDYHRNEVEDDVEKNMFGQNSNQNNRKTFTVGVQYITPWMFVADGRVDGEGKFRLQLSREDIPLTSRLRLAVMGNTDKEYMVGMSYILTKWMSISTHYDSDMGYGAGLTITY